MGTRSITRVIEDDGVLVTMYRQMDGYPSGMGKDLFEFLDDMVMVDGYNQDDTRKRANGGGCLAAQLVAHFKKGCGNYYLSSYNNQEEEYNYDISTSFSNSNIKVTVWGDTRFADPMFKGTVPAFGKWLKKEAKKAA